MATNWLILATHSFIKGLLGMAKINITRDAQIRQAIKEAKELGKRISYPVTGFKGLEVQVRLNKGLEPIADFRHRYTHPITGKRPYMTLGQYPALTLADARTLHSDNMALLAKGIDPIEFRDSQKQKELLDRMNTLDHFIKEWETIQATKNLSPETLYNHQVILRPIKKRLGHLRVTDITPSLVIKFITEIQKETPAKGLRVKSMLRSVLQLAKKHMIIEHNPASDLQGTLRSHNPSHQPAITEPEQFAKLLNDIDQLDDSSQLYNKRILQLLALTFVRIGDLCSMQWADINWLTKEWKFKPQKAGHRADMVANLVIPLAPQAIEILKQMQELTGDKDYVFYNERRRKAPYHHRQEINKVLNSDLMNDGKGYKGVHSPHGFRSSAKTMLMERLGYDELITELALGHAMLNQYGRAYNRMEGLDQRKKMMKDWADYLDNLRAGKIDNVIYPDFKQSEKVQNG